MAGYGLQIRPNLSTFRVPSNIPQMLVNKLIQMGKSLSPCTTRVLRDNYRTNEQHDLPLKLVVRVSNYVKSVELSH